MSKLSAHQRDDLKDSDFALSGRRYPIHDEAHARDALARVSQNGTPDEIKQVRAAVHRKFPNIKIAAAAGQAFVLIAASAAPFTDIAAPEGLPTEIDNEPVAYREKEMIYCGEFFDPKTGKEFVVTPERLDKWVANHARYTAAGYRVPLPAHLTDHPDTSDADAVDRMEGMSLGNLLTIERRGEKLFGLHQFIGADAIKAATRNGSSVFVEAGKIDAKGNVYDEVLTHNLITPKPLIPGLAPFTVPQSLAASDAGPVSVAIMSDISDKPAPTSTTKSTAKPPTSGRSHMELAKELRTLLGLPENAADETIATAVKDKLAALGTASKDLGDTKTALAASQTALSAATPKAVDDHTMMLLCDSLATKREAAARAVTPAIIQELDGLFMANDKPTPLALSQSAGRPLLSRVYDLMAKIKATVPTGQQSAHVAVAAAAGGVDGGMTDLAKLAGEVAAQYVTKQYPGPKAA